MISYAFLIQIPYILLLGSLRPCALVYCLPIISEHVSPNKTENITGLSFITLPLCDVNYV